MNGFPTSGTNESFWVGESNYLGENNGTGQAKELQNTYKKAIEDAKTGYHQLIKTVQPDSVLLVKTCQWKNFESNWY